MNFMEQLRKEKGPLEVIASNLYCNDLGPHYEQVKKNISKLVKRQPEFKRLTSGSLIYSSYLKLRGLFMEKVLKKRQYTLEELFDIQLRNISGLNSSLQMLLGDSREELERLESYYDRVNSEVITLLKNREHDNEMEDKSRRYREICSRMRGNAIDRSYFISMTEGKRLKRELAEYLHKHGMADELAKNLSQESFFLEKFEDLLRTSIHMCERIAIKTASYERHLRNTRQTYHILRVQQKTVKSLGNAVETMAGFTSSLQENLVQGLDRITEIANSGPEYYSTESLEMIELE